AARRTFRHAHEPALKSVRPVYRRCGCLSAACPPLAPVGKIQSRRLSRPRNVLAKKSVRTNVYMSVLSRCARQLKLEGGRRSALPLNPTRTPSRGSPETPLTQPPMSPPLPCKGRFAPAPAWPHCADMAGVCAALGVHHQGTKTRRGAGTPSPDSNFDNAYNQISVRFGWFALHILRR
ncbi:hypothetical protein DEV91_1741, partial [Phyllobacterium brassicacearum]